MRGRRIAIEDLGAPPDTHIGSPVCPQCLTPFYRGQYYCNKCEYAVGLNTPYIPFVNIPFNLSIFKHAWKRVWHDKETGLVEMVFYLVLIALFAWPMILALPFTLWGRRRRAREQH